jgi:hypothetical protein
VAAHAVRDPLRALRVQLLLAEQLRRAGRRTEAIDAVRRVIRAPAASLPPLLRRRREMLADLLIANTPLAAVVSRHVTGSGLPALALYLPHETSVVDTCRLPALWDDAIETLRLCQDAADERATATVCGRPAQLRAQRSPSSGWSGVLIRLAGNGGRIEPSIAERGCGAPIAPHRIEERVEAGAPVRVRRCDHRAVAVRWRWGSLDPDRASPR